MRPHQVGARAAMQTASVFISSQHSLVMKNLLRGQTATEMVLIIAAIVLGATIAIILASNVVSETSNTISNVTIFPK